MVLLNKVLFAGLLIFTLLACRQESQEIPLYAGLHLTASATIQADTFWLDPLPGDSAVIRISGNNIVVDFNGAVLRCTADPLLPDELDGWGIQILEGQNIELRNLHIQGYRGGIWASHCDSLHIFDSEINYLYRPTPEAPPNLNTPASAIYLDQCKAPLLHDLNIGKVHNGISLYRSSTGHIYNNTISFNSGTAIALAASNNQWIRHNRLDWNDRGFQIQKNCSENTIAYNSATHARQGIVLLDSTNRQQLIFGNDFSHATQQGALLSGSNNFIYNHLEDCAIGLVGNELHHSLLIGNYFFKNDRAKSFENSSENVLQGNSETSAPAYAMVAQYAPPRLADAQETALPEEQLRGRQYRLMQHWGPYDFREPIICLREVKGKRYTFAIFGPQGNWKMVGGQGFDYVSRKRGALPTTIVADTIAGTDSLAIELQFLGAAVQTSFGQPVAKGAGLHFHWTNR